MCTLAPSRISLRRLHRPIRDDSLRKCPSDPFLVFKDIQIYMEIVLPRLHSFSNDKF